jgi:phage gpG-like protein
MGGFSLMTASYHIGIMNQADVGKTYERIINRGRNLRPYFLAVTRDFRQMMVLQFSSEGVFLLGHRWRQLSERTIKNKAKLGQDPRILHATRRMRKSFTTGVEGYRVVTRDSLTIDSEVPYAGLHQTGYRSRSGSLVPKRQIVRIRQKDATRWGRMYVAWMVHGRIIREQL